MVNKIRDCIAYDGVVMRPRVLIIVPSFAHWCIRERIGTQSQSVPACMLPSHAALQKHQSSRLDASSGDYNPIAGVAVNSNTTPVILAKDLAKDRDLCSWERVARSWRRCRHQAMRVHVGDVELRICENPGYWV
jgi:hypothetical protein